MTHLAAVASAVRPIRLFGRYARQLDRLRIVALLAGCAFLFWQYDGAPADWLFVAGIAAAVALWLRHRATFDLAWPQVLVVLFLAVTAIATVAGGTLSAFLVTAYLVTLALALAAVLREDPRRIRLVEGGLILSGLLAALLTCVGYASRHFGWQYLELLSYDAYRGMGLFKDPNAAGAFTACTYPLAAAAASRTRFAIVLVPLATVAFGLGVVFSFSREALLLFAAAVLGVGAYFVISRARRVAASLALVCLVAVVSAGALDRLPAYRGYQLLEAYDQNGRFVAWRFGIDMLREAPLGTGSGSFEKRSEARFNEIVASLPKPLDLTNRGTPPAVDESLGYRSAIASQPATVDIAPGAVSDVLTVSFRNTGTRAWKRGVAGQEARLGIGESGLLLDAGSAGVIARFSHFDDKSESSLNTGWLAFDRVAAQQEAEVAPGAEGSFKFQIRAPRDAGTYQLHLRPVIDGTTWMDEQGVVLEVRVDASASGTLSSYVESVAPPAGGDILAPTPPSRYALPAGAITVSTSRQLMTALAQPAARDIVLADGVYDNPEPFYNPFGHRLYAATLGGAVLRAGLSMGANEGPGGGVAQGLVFDIADPAKTLGNSAINVWGSGAGTRILDVAINGNSAIANGLLIQPLDRLAIQRVQVRSVMGYGIAVLAGKAPATPLQLEDVTVVDVHRAPAVASTAKDEACLWLATTTTVRRALIRSCGATGVWIGSGNNASLLEYIDVDGTPQGIRLDETTSQLAMRYVHVGERTGAGMTAAGLAPRQPGRSPAAGDLVVVPSAHNTYFRVAAESGVLGFTAFGAYLILMFWSLWTRRWREHWALNLALALVLFAGMGIDTLHWRLLWIYVAMAGAVGLRAPQPITAPRLPRPVVRRLQRVVAWGAQFSARTVATMHTYLSPLIPAALRSLAALSHALRELRHVFVLRPQRREDPASRPLPGPLSEESRLVPPMDPSDAIAQADGSAPLHIEPPAFGAQAAAELTRARARLRNLELRLGFDHPDVAAELHLIGAIHHDAQRYSEAIGYYAAALTIRERVLGSDHPEVVAILHDMAAARREEGELLEADALLSRARFTTPEGSTVDKPQPPQIDKATTSAPRD